MAERFLGAAAWEGYGLLSGPDQGVTISDANSRLSRPSIEAAETHRASVPPCCGIYQIRPGGQGLNVLPSLSFVFIYAHR